MIVNKRGGKAQGSVLFSTGDWLDLVDMGSDLERLLKKSRS